ncbi:MAG: TonB family protein [Thermoanaerobaculia bacterium]
MVPPTYPAEAIRRRLRGLVVLRVLISETGLPVEVQRVQGAPMGLTEAAEEAVRQWRFEPAVSRGEPVRTWTSVRIPFEAIPFATPSPVHSPGPTLTPPAAAERPAPAPPPAERPAQPAPSPRPAAPPSPAAGPNREAPPPVPPEPPSGERAPEPPVLRARRALKLSLSPDQARVFLDGRYVGIVDDWDNFGGGLLLPLGRGPHLVRLELPGYRPYEAEIDVAANAEKDVAEIGNDLVRTVRTPFARLTPAVATTRRFLALVVDPPDAVVRVNGGPEMAAPTVTGADPIELPAPGVHDITISAPGRAMRTLRVLSSPNAPADLATVRVRLNAR